MNFKIKSQTLLMMNLMTLVQFCTDIDNLHVGPEFPGIG